MYIHVSWSWRHLGIVGHLFQIGIAILGFYVGKKKKNFKSNKINFLFILY